jgi:hypothetical protein
VPGKCGIKEASVAKIIVKNDDWDGARARLQSSLDAQRTDFNAKMKAAFAPQQTAEPAAKAATAPAGKPSGGGLPRFRRSN